jgi:membrane-associated protease RseP (regulator of RpoE activity)
VSQHHSPRERLLAAALFTATLLSTLWVGAEGRGVDLGRTGIAGLAQGASFALPLLAILVSHELGHYIAARIHGVPSSLPMFIPMPYGLIGTFGAVIRTSGRIGTRDALLDIGAAGPLAGLCVALPVLAYGLAHSEVLPLDPHAAMEGRSLLYWAVLRAVHGQIPAGYDVYLNPTAFAGWVGLLVTMMNLVPSGQLDGGHVAYALFGPQQDRYSRWVRHGLLVAALAIGLFHAFGAPEGTGPSERLERARHMGANWLVWWALLSVMARWAGERHVPLAERPLSPVRARVAWGTLLLFPLLFMPTWFSLGDASAELVTQPLPEAPSPPAP